MSEEEKNFAGGGMEIMEAKLEGKRSFTIR